MALIVEIDLFEHYSLLAAMIFDYCLMMNRIFDYNRPKVISVIWKIFFQLLFNYIFICNVIHFKVICITFLSPTPSPSVTRTFTPKMQMSSWEIFQFAKTIVLLFNDMCKNICGMWNADFDCEKKKIFQHTEKKRVMHHIWWCYFEINFDIITITHTEIAEKG